MQEVLCVAQGKAFCWVIAANYLLWWSGDNMVYLFTPKEIKLIWTVLCFILQYAWCTPTGLIAISVFSGENRWQWSDRGGRNAVHDMVEFCFPLWSHKWLGFCTEVLKQLAFLLNVCQIMLGFQRVKETLSRFFWKPVLNFFALLPYKDFSFKCHVVHHDLYVNSRARWPNIWSFICDTFMFYLQL